MATPFPVIAGLAVPLKTHATIAAIPTMTTGIIIRAAKVVRLHAVMVTL